MGKNEDSDKLAIFKHGRKIYFFDEINNETVAEAIKYFQILEEESKVNPITLIINSEGGSIYDGLALFDRIKISPCQIITIGTGFVASMGFVVFLAGDERIITPSTVLLNHQNWDEIIGRTNDLKIQTAEVVRLENYIINLISKITGNTVKKIRDDIAFGDKYIAPAEALTQGYAHKMVNYVTKKVVNKKINKNNRKIK